MWTLNWHMICTTIILHLVHLFVTTISAYLNRGTATLISLTSMICSLQVAKQLVQQLIRLCWSVVWQFYSIYAS